MTLPPVDQALDKPDRRCVGDSTYANELRLRQRRPKSRGPPRVCPGGLRCALCAGKFRLEQGPHAPNLRYVPARVGEDGHAIRRETGVGVVKRRCWMATRCRLHESLG